MEGADDGLGNCSISKFYVHKPVASSYIHAFRADRFPVFQRISLVVGSWSEVVDMSNYSVTFSRDIMGVPFPVASFVVRHARTPDRARRAAELRLMRRRHLSDWRLCADALEIEPQGRREESPPVKGPR